MLKMKLIASVMLIVLTTALIGGLTGAWFTDADNAGTATFTAGTLDVDVSDGLTSFDVLDTAKLAAMEPGDDFGPVIINIKNMGTKNLAWFGNWTVTLGDPAKEALLDKLYIKNMSMQFFKADGVTEFYPQDNFIVNGEGIGWFAGLESTADGVVTLRNWNNNAGMLPGTVYEHMGALKPGAKYVITVEFGFHYSADNAYQGNASLVSPVTVGFTVDATQVNEAAINAFLPGIGTNQIGWLNTQIGVQ